jgi:hypothetical protein
MLIGITISVNYDDYLTYCLTNAQVLDHWYVVIDPADEPTLALLKDIPNATLVPFNFQEGGHIFNKSGAIHHVQKIVHEKYPEAWILLVDSDTILPLDLRTTLDKLDLNREYLHGASRAFYQTPQQLAEDKPTHVESHGCWGFFHLYYDKTKYVLPFSRNAARYDDAYKALFGHQRIRILPITVKHLGDGYRNWDGRKTARFG